MLFLLQEAAQGRTPTDCLLSGTCGAVLPEANRVPGGLMFLAVGLVLLGGYGWYRSRRPVGGS